MAKIDGYKILVKDCYADVHEDSYEKGELDYVNTWNMREYKNKTYDSIEDLVSALHDWGFSKDVKDYGFFDGKITSDILMNIEGYEADKHELEQWEKGEIKLYVAQLFCEAEVITARPMTEDDADMLGLETY